MAGVFEKTSDKFDDEENAVQEVKKTNFDYEGYEISDSKLINSLVDKENNIQKLANQALRVSIEMARNLYEAREELASYKSGTFYACCEPGNRHHNTGGNQANHTTHKNDHNWFDRGAKSSNSSVDLFFVKISNLN